VDVLFANEAEALELTGESDMDRALEALTIKCQTVVVTLGAAGCIVVTGGQRLEVPAENVTSVVDTTGAGDSFAAGYLYGIVNDLGARRSAEIGNRLAAEVITHLGARPLEAERARIGSGVRID
jgi:sugar/nucleoside kinase (ribokinase family)